MFAPCKKQVSGYSCASLVPLGMKWDCICAGRNNVLHSRKRVSMEQRKCGIWCVARGVSCVGAGGVVWNVVVVVLLVCCCVVDCRLVVVGCVSVLVDE